MTITFKSITKARQYLSDTGYSFFRHGALTTAEVYKAGPLVALLKRSRKGVTVRIG